MKEYRFLSYVSLFVVTSMLSCSELHHEFQLFEQLSSDDTGISFSNTITENDSVNVLDYYYCYNGGGVAVGDFNNDSLVDIFFSGNMVSSRLYLNQGNFQFQDITEESGINTASWVTGVSVVDINTDGWLDIYLNVAGSKAEKSYPNLLFINQGIQQNGQLSFEEAAREYGLADTAYSVQSAFFDYDRDGDLDMYLMTNTVNFVDKSYVHDKDYPLTEGLTTDKLYRNTGVSDSLGHPLFIDISEAAGIMHEGYGLGIAIDDLNADGWPDVYVANDFMPNDLLYINQQDGSFREQAARSQRHQSYNGMGVDISDVNNDLLPDIMVVDMLPENNERRKTTIAEMNYERFRRELGAGYIPQFMRNTLQINRGNDPEGITQFADVSQLSGVHATDWSWAPLFADFDNDGLRDIYITNGFVKDITNLDFGRYVASSTVFGTELHKKERKKELAAQLKSVKVSNFLYQNAGAFAFVDQSAAWGIRKPSFSNGAAHADLDNDGDLDLVVNNINEEAFIFRNRSEEREEKNFYLRLRLKGSTQNPGGIGAKLFVYQGENSQYYYHMPVRGYLSSIHTPVHIGLGTQQQVDSIKIIWPDGKQQLLKSIQSDQAVVFDYQQAHRVNGQKSATKSSALFTEVNDSCKVHFQHQENTHIDFYSEPLLPKMYSQGGPGIAVGQIDGEPGDDFLLGGAKGFAATLFLQNRDASFAQQTWMPDEKEYEDMGMLLFDYDEDGDNDLYVVSGGSEFKADTKAYQDRLYSNDGQGNFSLMPDALPQVTASGSCVVGSDYDQDGDIDLFVGGRYLPNAYPKAPKSYLLENDKKRFYDKTQEVEGLSELGMVNAASWTDFDNDGWIDLIVVGEWMPVTFFQNQQGNLVNITEELGLENTQGWWSSIQAVDLDMDGDMDYVLGNMGTNVDYAPSDEKPLNIYAYDYDANGKLDPLLTRYLVNRDDEEAMYPFHSRDDIFRQLVPLKKSFQGYEEFASSEVGEIIPTELLSKAEKFKASHFESIVLLNQGGHKFAMRPLPVEAQFSAVYGIQSDDFNADGIPDLLLSGNSYANEILYGWQDASLGVMLLGDGKGGFDALTPQESGLYLKGDTRGLCMMHDLHDRKLFIAAVNADSLKILSPSRQAEQKLLQANPMDAYVLIEYQNGSVAKHEFQYGSAYLSQSARTISISQTVKSIRIVDYQGRERKLDF
ncbi:hypothetical protein OKW21_003871 [Catalinimonas alkaloidigena]|uniref:VCBS repeat-containing protein n=1 Tax=Catalinimonas alkaloidigena TaxID=1075417 RepID=UPI00240611A8|nr:VCBS repeat-containing protein [Catalinimonas alkaloidigena]MDF9798608.1 hypothetical protein [Catalinimonas alkaloidigena]